MKTKINLGFILSDLGKEIYYELRKKHHIPSRFPYRSGKTSTTVTAKMPIPSLKP